MFVVNYGTEGHLVCARGLKITPVPAQPGQWYWWCYGMHSDSSFISCSVPFQFPIFDNILYIASFGLVLGSSRNHFSIHSHSTSSHFKNLSFLSFFVVYLLSIIFHRIPLSFLSYNPLIYLDAAKKPF